MHNSRDSVRKFEKAVAEVLKAAQAKSLLVAVSGGADSVALLRSCARLAPILGLRLQAVNCNFHLRAEESDRDSAFTAALCRRLGIPLHRLDYDVALHMERHPDLSVEMACRELRYADFFRICREEALDRVAVAHNADDDVETLMLALLRGSGTRGLRGMDADNGRVIRPLLSVTRSEIESYLQAIGQDFITDSSNLSSDFRRNFIRRDVLPLLESRWPGARKSLSRTLSIMKEEAAIADAHYRRQLTLLSPDPATLLVYAPEVSTGTILRFLEPFGGNPAIAEEILKSRSLQHGARHWRLSASHTAVLERDRLIISDHGAALPSPEVNWEKLRMSPSLMDEIKRNRSHDVVYLPHDESAYELRLPAPGDRMAPLGMKGSRLVSDIISDARLDSRQKAGIRVLVRRSDGEIIWVSGLKRSRHDLVVPSAPHAYRCQLTPPTLNPQPLTLNP